MKKKIYSRLAFVVLTSLFALCHSVTASPADLGNTITLGPGRDPDVAVDSDGNLHVVYIKGVDTYYRKVTNPANDTPVIGSEYLVGRGVNPQVEVDSQKNPHIVFGTADYSYWTGSGFSTPERAFDGWRKNLIEIDSEDRVYILCDVYEPRQVLVKIYQFGEELTPFPINVGRDNPGGMQMARDNKLHITMRDSGRHEYSRLFFNPETYPTNQTEVYRTTIQTGTSDFSWITVGYNYGLRYFGTKAYAQGIFYRHSADYAAIWSPTETLAVTESRQEDGDFVNPVADTDASGYTYCTFSGRNHLGYYIVIDSANNFIGTYPIDPEAGSRAGSKFTNPNIAADPSGDGAYITWGEDFVRVRSVGKEKTFYWAAPFYPGWNSHPSFGDFNISGYPFIYHLNHGWLYVFADQGNSLLYYDFTSGKTLFADIGLYPHLYDFSTGSWWYYLGTTNPRWFYGYSAMDFFVW